MKLFTKTTSTLALALSLTLGAYATEVPKTDAVVAPSLLSFTAPKDAKGLVKEVYDEIKAKWGFVPVVIQQYSLNPKLLKAQWDLYSTLGDNKNFDPKMMTMMRMLVSEKHDCEYCVGLNKGMLLNMFKLPMDEVNAIAKDPSTAKLDEKQKTMLLFMIKAANTPHDITAKDIEKLKKLGWSDKDVFEGVKSAANMVSGAIVIDALKIQKDY
jgi:uncharacterized peroxidase-related enzyme